VCVCLCKEQRSKDHLFPDVSFRHMPPGMHGDKNLNRPCEKRQTSDTLMYTNIRKRFTFIHVSLNDETYLTTFGSHPFRSKIVLHVSFQGQHQLQA